MCACVLSHFALLKHFATLLQHFAALTMDARSTAAVRAVRLVVSQANDAAVAENARLRCAVERAVVAVEQGDRVLALRLLAVALSRDPVPVVPPRTRGHVCVCVLCGARKRSVVQMSATGRWTMLPVVDRLLCMPCFRLQPPQ